MSRRIAYLVCALILLCAIRVVLAHEGVDAAWNRHVLEVDRHFGPAELLHYTLLTVLGLPAAALLCGVCSERTFARLVALVARGGLWTPALVATLASFCISRFVTHGAWFTDDEQAYLFQMEAYRRGVMTLPALEPERLFHHPFVIVAQMRDGVAHWAGTYPVMQPAMMALSSLFGEPLLSQWLSVGLIAFHAGRLSEELTGESSLGLGAAWLCASSPMLIGLGATYHTSVLACLLSLLALRMCLAVHRKPTLARGALLGLFAGATFLTRGLEGALIVVASSAVLLRACWAQPWSGRWALLSYAAVGAVALLSYALVNLATTGSWHQTAYAVWERDMGRIMGFGAPMMWQRTHTFAHGVGQTFVTLTRMNAWMFAWPVSLLAPLLALALPLRSQAPRLLLALSGLQLSGYFFLAFGSVHDFGGAYHVFHVPLMAAVLMSVLQSVRACTSLGPRLALGMSVVGLITFWPSQLKKWRTTSRYTLEHVAAAQAATRGTKAIVLWETARPPGTDSNVNHPPAPFPEHPIWWAFDTSGAEQELRRRYPERTLYRLRFLNGVPHVERVDP